MKKVIFSIIILLSQVHFPVQSNSWIKDSCRRITDFFNINRDFCNINSKSDNHWNDANFDKLNKNRDKIISKKFHDIIKNLKKYCVKSGPSLNHDNEKKCRSAINALKSQEEILKKDQTEDFSGILDEIDKARKKYIKAHNKNFPMHKPI